MLTALAVSGCRSLRDVVVPLAGLNLVTGANGSGKSNLYRALRLLADVAQGRAIASLAQEGGLSSVLWAGPEQVARSVKAGQHAVQGTRRKGPISLKLGFASEITSAPTPRRRPACRRSGRTRRSWATTAATSPRRSRRSG
jgi:predicted ATPase